MHKRKLQKHGLHEPLLENTWYFRSGLLHFNEKPKSKPSRLHFSVTTNKISNVLYRAK